MLTTVELAKAGIELTEENPPRELLKIIKAQRQSCSGQESNGWRHAIGGPVILTALTSEGITQRKIADLPITPCSPHWLGLGPGWNS
jgi:hypothetical protein